MRKRIVGSVIALVVLTAAMLIPGAGRISPQPVDAKQVSVSIVDLAFSSSNITVNVGDTVKWTNNGAVPHTVTSASVGGPLDSGQLAPGDTYQFTFNDVGTFNYKCLNHFSMTGTIHVVSGSPTPTRTATPKPNTPSIKLDKDKSKYNGVIRATLAGFTPAKTITAAWPDGTTLFQVKANSSGNATGTFRTPLAPSGNYKVTAKDSSGRTASTNLRVIPRIMLAPSSEGPIGTVFRVYLYGFSAGESVSVRWYASDGVKFQVLKTLTIADTGRASSLVTVPAGSASGDHKISGNVIGVSRSASTTFTVTSSAAASAEDAHSTATSTPNPAATSTVTAVVTDTPIASATASEVPTSTSVATETLTRVPEETSTPTATIDEIVDPATPAYDNGN